MNFYFLWILQFFRLAPRSPRFLLVSSSFCYEHREEKANAKSYTVTPSCSSFFRFFKHLKRHFSIFVSFSIVRATRCENRGAYASRGSCRGGQCERSDSYDALCKKMPPRLTSWKYAHFLEPYTQNEILHSIRIIVDVYV